MSLLCPSPRQEGNELFLNQEFMSIAKYKECSKEDKQDSKMLGNIPAAHSLFIVTITDPDPSWAELF